MNMQHRSSTLLSHLHFSQSSVSSAHGKAAVAWGGATGRHGHEAGGEMEASPR